jgi:hypothetical protein
VWFGRSDPFDRRSKEAAYALRYVEFGDPANMRVTAMRYSTMIASVPRHQRIRRDRTQGVDFGAVSNGVLDGAEQWRAAAQSRYQLPIALGPS